MKDYNVSKEIISENILEAARFNSEEIANVLNSSKSIENDLVFLNECLKAIQDNQNIISACICKDCEDVIEIEIEHEFTPCSITWNPYSDTIYDLVKAKLKKEELQEAFQSFKNPNYKGEDEDSILDVIHIIAKSL